MTSEEFRADHVPLGYFITIRAYGTWLHGKAGSVDRFHNVYGTPKLPANVKRKQYNRRLLAEDPASFDTKARRAIKEGIQETCDIRKWTLWAFNCRTNHVHTVVTANCKAKKVVTAFQPTLRGNCAKLNVGQVTEVLGSGEEEVRSIYGPRKS
jgi:hypothetical protein